MCMIFKSLLLLLLLLSYHFVIEVYVILLDYSLFFRFVYAGVFCVYAWCTALLCMGLVLFVSSFHYQFKKACFGFC